MSESRPRMVPVLPPRGQRLRVIFDTDFANEIDDLYAISLAICATDRFDILGFSAAHFAQKTGRASIEASRVLLHEVLAVAGWKDRVPVVRGSDPLRYMDEPQPSEGTELIIGQARTATPDEPLWVVGLGAASTLASAILIDPGILSRIRFVFHARSELTWPTHSDQFNVWGDIKAARCLLDTPVPLVWFDTGQQLTCSVQETATRLAPCGSLGAYLHAFRDREPYFRAPDKGFFDVADVAWMIDPELCTNEVIEAPRMNWAMRFDHPAHLGSILRVSSIRPQPAWELFFERLRRGPG